MNIWECAGYKLAQADYQPLLEAEDRLLTDDELTDKRYMQELVNQLQAKVSAAEAVIETGIVDFAKMVLQRDAYQPLLEAVQMLVDYDETPEEHKLEYVTTDLIHQVGAALAAIGVA